MSSLKSCYKWLIVFISFVNIAAAFGIKYCFGIFFVPILEEFNWSRATIAGAFSLSSVLLGLSSWFTGGLVDRFGSRKILIGGSILLSFSVFASARIQEIWHLYALFGIFVSLGICGLGLVPHSVLLSNWFVENRGTVVGFTFSGMGVGILLIGPLAQILISSYGWRAAYIFVGLSLLVLLVPLNYFIKDWPNKQSTNSKDIARGTGYSFERQEDSSVNKGNSTQEEGHTLTSSMKTLAFWCLFIAFLLVPLGIYPVMIHQVAYVVDYGYSKMLAASIFGTIGLLSSVGRFAFGTLSDRIGRQLAVTLSFMCSIAGIIILLFLPSLGSIFWLYLYAVLFGVGFGARGPIITAMMADIFQGRHFGNIYGFINLGNGIGGALGPWMGGYIHDVTGSYTILFIMCIPVLGIACLLFWIID